MIRISQYVLILLISIIFISCNEDKVNNPVNISELKILSTSPSTGASLESSDFLLSIKFDDFIYAGNLSIKLINFNDNSLIEKISLSNIQIKDSSLFFNVSKKFEYNKKYYVIIDSGAISFSPTKIIYKGFNDKQTWMFTYIGNDLNIKETYPANNSKLVDYKTPFKITFDNKISAGNLSIKIIDYNSLNVVEIVNPTKITIKDSSIIFNISSKLESEKRYSILIDSGAIKYANEQFLYKGIKSKLTWSFYSPRILPETNIMRATISGAYSYLFEEKTTVQFNYYDFNKMVLTGAKNTENNHQLILLFKLSNSSNNVYSLTSAEMPSSYTVSQTEDYLSDSEGKVKILENNDVFFEAEFNFTGKLVNNQRTVTVSNGYIFVYKK